MSSSTNSTPKASKSSRKRTRVEDTVGSDEDSGEHGTMAVDNDVPLPPVTVEPTESERPRKKHKVRSVIIGDALKRRLGESEISWQAYSLTAGAKGKWGTLMEQENFIIMRFYATHNITVFGPGNKYSVDSPTSLVAFWTTELGITPKSITKIDGSARQGKAYFISIGKNCGALLAESLPRGLTKVAKGLGFALSIPSPEKPNSVACSIKNVPYFIGMEELAEVLLQSPFIAKVGSLEKVLCGSTFLGKINADLESVKGGSNPPDNLRGFFAPHQSATFKFEVTAGDFKIEVVPKPVCHVCAQGEHADSECSVAQRLTSETMTLRPFVGVAQATPKVVQTPVEEKASEASTSKGKKKPKKSSKGKDKS
jgi:hypothetical protein